ncbi:MAG: hypothetical protein NTAFB05_12780 [Nitrobacter sp.]|uniref:FecR domain-containing protein n=1 Tax=Nitrobacter sp. TaxID=29420 RepID=UPI00387DDD91
MSRTGALQIAMTVAAMALGGAMARAQQVGTASAVNPAATANMRTITIGQSIAHKERIQTKSSGSVQLLFLDKTSMTIGPNSDLTIDEYVYDPNANTGKLAATLGKGALRFVGGQISHNGDAEIKTASALIGIRGGVMMTDGKGIYSGYGTMTVNSGGQTVTLHAGEFTQTRAGGPPTLPGLPPPGFVQQLILAFQSAAGQTGGARRGAASPANVASAEQKATGSSGFVTGSNMPTPVNPVVGLINAISSTFTQSVQTSSQDKALQQIAQDQPKDDSHNSPPVDNTPRPTVMLTGYVAGLDNVAGNQTVNPISGTSKINLDATNNRVQANLDTYIYDSGNPFTQLAHTVHALFQFGSNGSTGPANGTYVDYNNFYANTPDNNYVVNGLPAKGVIVSANGITTNQIVTNAIPNLTPCQCDYTRWGFWAIDWSNTNTGTPIEVALGTWVAGRPVGSISDVPTTGTATYTGHVIANVQSAGFVAGGFSNTVNFGARTGAVSVTGLDSTNYSGTVNFNTDPRNFGGTIAGNVGGRSMALQGSFFQGKSSPVGEMGGSVAISGANNYLGSGIFAASKR